MGYDYTFKVLLLGDSSSGKKEFVNRYISGFFQDDLSLTIGVDFYSKTTKFKGKTIKLQIWYFRGEQRFIFLLQQYCKDTHGAIIMYDITNLKSLESLPDWTQILREHLGDIPILLVGNKLDLEKSRLVPKEEGVLTAKKYNLSACFEVSSKTGKNVDKVFEDLIRLILAYEEYQTPIKMKKYEEFIVYDLKNTGYPTKLNINPEELQYHLNPKNVLIIIHNDLNRIFIWKGARSSVRKRFISARIAQELKNDLIKDALYHSCKIVSINQGEELQEFLNAFRLESMEVTDPLPDMSYPRNAKEANLLFDNLITSFQRYPSKKRFSKKYLRLFLEKFRDLSDNDKNTFIQSLKDEETKEKSDRDDVVDVGFLYWKDYLRLFLEKFRDSSDNDKNTIIQSLKDEETKEKSDRDDDGDDRFPYPYIFKPPEPPDDLALAPRAQVRHPPKKKDTEDEVNCQYCGMKLTKEEQLIHSCKKKPKNK